jgi:protein-L-isoaspartate(D-aspartate) O-methyltransferase
MRPFRRRQDDASLRRALAENLARQGIGDPRVLNAMATVPRHRFVPDHDPASAYADRALPISEGQTISQPYVVALMAQAAELIEGAEVLEIGTGSGYGAAILAEIVGPTGSVLTIERLPALAATARRRLADAGLANVTVEDGDGTAGWEPGAPWDAVVVTAGGPEVPDRLVEQLSIGGRLVIPVGDRQRQQLVRIRRTATGVAREDLGPVAFVPLIGEAGW